jgi:hypothetical protein
MLWDNNQLDNNNRPASIQRLRKMHGAPVHILRGPYAESRGLIKAISFDATIQNTVYTILIAGLEEEFIATIPAADCAIYYPVGHRVRVVMGTYTGKCGYVTRAMIGSTECRVEDPAVTACKYNAADRFYEIRICMSADQFEARLSPFDIHETFPATMLAPAAGL